MNRSSWESALHDLAALEKTVAGAPEFRELVLAAVAADVGRGGEDKPPTDPDVIFGIMLQRLEPTRYGHENTSSSWQRFLLHAVLTVSISLGRSPRQRV